MAVSAFCLLLGRTLVLLTDVLLNYGQFGIYLHHPYDERTEQIITNRQVN